MVYEALEWSAEKPYRRILYRTYDDDDGYNDDYDDDGDDVDDVDDSIVRRVVRTYQLYQMRRLD